jgi:NAD(P)-dependent dehydrogenase (short-subunit alcohol dehydrogenase family)
MNLKEQLAGGEGFLLGGKRAVVTGAGRGIGRAIALAFARAGADLAVTARTTSELEAICIDVETIGRKCVYIACDVVDPESVRAMAEAAFWGLGGLDILVNNAGNAESHKFLDHPDDLWHRMIAINLTSVYYVTKALAPRLVESNGGRIINIASTAARIGDKYVAAYTAAKHGVLGLTRSLAAELMQHNITVNAICPGFVDTPMTQASIANIVNRTGMSEADALAALERTSPQNRLIDPDEIAGLAVYLASDSSRGITGQAINVDGGAVMS